MIRLQPKRNADPAVGAAGSFKSKASFAPLPTRIVIAGFHRFPDEIGIHRSGLVALHSS